MSKENIFKISISIAFIASLIFLVSSLLNIFNPKEKVLITEKSFNAIASSIGSETKSTEYLKLVSVEGNKEYVALTYKDIRYTGEKNTYNVIYDVRKNKIIKDIEHKDASVKILDSSIVKYVKDDLFLIVSSSGNVFTLDTSKEDFKLNLIIDTEITKEAMFKYILVDRTLYVMTRDYNSNYNEKVLNNSNVYEIKFDNKKFSKAQVSTHEFSDEELIYSFVVDSNKDVGVVGSSYVSVPSEEVNKYKLPSDETYLKNLPSSDKNYKFIDQTKIWIKILHDGRIIEVPTSAIDLTESNIHHFIKSQLGLNLSVPSNIPMVLDNSYILYSTYKYETVLYDPAIKPVASTFKVVDGVKEDDISTIRSELLMYNHKDYIAFFNSNKGLVGVKPSGEVQVISESLLTFPFKNTLLYMDKGNLSYKR